MKQPNTIPAFTHPEIEALYNYDLNIPREKVEAILQLPRVTLIEDLKKVLADTINRFDYFKIIEWDEDSMEFPLHSLWLLADLKAAEALPDVLNILRQNEEFLDYWFNDFLTEDFWEALYHIGGNNLEALKAFIFEPNIYWAARGVISTTIQKIALHQPNRRTQIIAWYQSVFEHFLSLEDNDPSINIDVLTFMVIECFSFNAKELLPGIKKIYERNWILPIEFNSFEELEKEMESHCVSSFEKRIVFSNIFERYKATLSSWHFYRMKYDENFRKQQEDRLKPIPKTSYSSNFEKPQTVVRDGKKVGRNDPCPCGSGKKYKKCCL